MCPSYIAKSGVKLYGIVNGNGCIDYLNSTLKINQDFIDEVSKGGYLEKRFRFAGNCSKNGCNQWANVSQRCGLINKIISILDNPENETLKYCPIRSKCRWFQQSRGLAFSQCNEVIRKIEQDVVDQN